MKELILVDKEELKQVFLEFLGTHNQVSKEISTNPTSNYISASDVAKRTGSHITTVRRWTSEGLLNSYKIHEGCKTDHERYSAQAGKYCEICQITTAMKEGYPRSSFVFYGSFYEALEGLPDEDKISIVQAIIEYGLYGKEPEFQGFTKCIFTLIKPQIDANQKKFMNGQKGAEHGINGGRKPQHNPTETPNVNVNENVISVEFEKFRKRYPGSKNGFTTELSNLKKKTTKSEISRIVSLLLPALEKEIAHKQNLKTLGKFVPEWKNLKTWIGNKCWEQEFPADELFKSAKPNKAEQQLT